jgi:hypothetical protein
MLTNSKQFYELLKDGNQTSKIELSEKQCTPVFSVLILIVNYIFSTKKDNLNKSHIDLDI